MLSFRSGAGDEHLALWEESKTKTSTHPHIQYCIQEYIVGFKALCTFFCHISICENCCNLLMHMFLHGLAFAYLQLL